MTEPRTCLYVDESMLTPRGYIPVLVTEGEPGYRPLSGRGELAEPWLWGHDINDARRLCAETNRELGIDTAAARAIVDTAITRQISTNYIETDNEKPPLDSQPMPFVLPAQTWVYLPGTQWEVHSETGGVLGDGYHEVLIRLEPRGER